MDKKLKAPFHAFYLLFFCIILQKEKNYDLPVMKICYMETKNLFDPAVKKNIIARINKLTPLSKALWGKMTVGQMLAHCLVPIGAGLVTNTIPRTFIGRIFGPFAKKMLYIDKPFKCHLPTDPSFVMKDEKDFEKEKQG